ncbi:hypothetical protein BJ741DRAFT_586647 [Chytriomyces cf. hyalinus JEL632]|nr:hypothetical protein BJ741DRAFT_586647 [Chytriomyces cf. hyalinus JEL632]
MRHRGSHALLPIFLAVSASNLSYLNLDNMVQISGRVPTAEFIPIEGFERVRFAFSQYSHDLFSVLCSKCFGMPNGMDLIGFHLFQRRDPLIKIKASNFRCI